MKHVRRFVLGILTMVAAAAFVVLVYGFGRALGLEFQDAASLVPLVIFGGGTAYLIGATLYE